MKVKGKMRMKLAFQRTPDSNHGFSKSSFLEMSVFGITMVFMPWNNVRTPASFSLNKV